MLQKCCYKNTGGKLQKCLLLCFGLFILIPVFAQFNLTIVLTGSPASHTGDPVFVAGNFNGWNPAETNYQLPVIDGITKIELKAMTAGNYQFKFTRGSWQKVECAADGKDVSNHALELYSDTTIYFSIAGWADDFTRVPKHHTASSNVSIMDTAFEIPQLRRLRRIWIYLPPGYSSSKKRYPVIYLQDGQNVFDQYTAAYDEEWGVDESLDSLISEGVPPCIVVGIDNGGDKRMNEYNPYKFTWKDSASSKTFLPEGDEYLAFIVRTLKPYIDKRYRTKTGKENTTIAGASMGGLISYYAILKYPKVFGNAGIFSPAFWTADGIETLTDSIGKKLEGKLFFYIGEAEGKEYGDQMNQIAEKIGKSSSALIWSVTDPNGIHNEVYWRKWFPDFYKWIMADGFNVLTKPKN